MSGCVIFQLSVSGTMLARARSTVPCGLGGTTVSSLLICLLCSLWTSLRTAQPAHPEARFQVLEMGESLKATGDKGGEDIIRKPKYYAVLEILGKMFLAGP